MAKQTRVAVVLFLALTALFMGTLYWAGVANGVTDTPSPTPTDTPSPTPTDTPTPTYTPTPTPPPPPSILADFTCVGGYGQFLIHVSGPSYVFGPVADLYLYPQHVYVATLSPIFGNNLYGSPTVVGFGGLIGTQFSPDPLTLPPGTYTIKTAWGQTQLSTSFVATTCPGAAASTATPTPTPSHGSPTVTATPSVLVKGDMNCDGKVTVADVLAVLRIVAGLPPAAGTSC
jgi:hypothetical protein